MAAELVTLVVAAGESRRFHGIKLAASLSGGEPILTHSLRKVMSVCAQTYVVLGAHAEQLQPLIPDSVNVLNHTHWCNGLGASIAFGTGEVLKQTKCDGVMVLLADQIAITEDELARFVAHWQTEPECWVAAEYQGQLGVPLIAPRSSTSHLLCLEGDRVTDNWLNEPASRDQIRPFSLASAGRVISSQADLEQFLASVDNLA